MCILFVIHDTYIITTSCIDVSLSLSIQSLNYIVHTHALCMLICALYQLYLVEQPGKEQRHHIVCIQLIQTLPLTMCKFQNIIFSSLTLRTVNIMIIKCSVYTQHYTSDHVLTVFYDQYMTVNVVY